MNTKRDKSCHSSIFMHKYAHGLLPDSFNDKYMLNNKCHNYSTKSPTLRNNPQYTTNRLKNSIPYRGPDVWNNLPVNPRLTTAINMFKKNVKIHFRVVC